MKSRLSLYLSCILAFFFVKTALAQNHQGLRLNLNIGLNISKFSNDGFSWKSGKMPFIGTSIFYDITERFALRGSADYSPKSSIGFNPNKKIANQYLDLTFTPSFKIWNDFRLHAGVCYSHILSSNFITLKGDNPNGVEKTKIASYGSEQNVLIGFDLKMQENIHLTCNYTIPTDRTNTFNFQVGLRIALNKRKKKEPSCRDFRIQNASQEINELKNSVLLVRLKTSENSIQALINAGETEKADKMRLSQLNENKKIISAFKQNFTFCEVKFFFSNTSEQVRQKQFDQIFLNDSLQVDASISLDTNASYFIAEFGYIDQNNQIDTGSCQSGASSNMRFYSLRMMNNQFVQLQRPFPYYVRTISKSMKVRPEQILFVSPLFLTSLDWSYDETVARLNRKLEKYLEKSSN